MNAKQILSNLWSSLVPTRPLVVDNSRYEPPSVAKSLSVDMLLSILEEAEGGDTRRLFSVYRDMMGDAHFQNLVNTRKLAVLGDTPFFTPANESPEAKRAQELVAAAWKALPGKREALTHLLDAALYPVSLVEKIYEPATVPGLRWQWATVTGVQYHLLWFGNGRLQLEQVSADGMPLGRWDEVDRTRFLVHRGNLLTSHADKWGGPMRAALFWWLFKSQDRGWWVEFLARFGMPFPIGKYPDGRADSRGLLERAFGSMHLTRGLVVSDGTQVELVQAASAKDNGEAFQNFQKFADEQLSKLVLGQTMTVDAASSGMGSNQAEVHERGANAIREFDATALGETMREQMFTPLLQLNGVSGELAPFISWGAEDTFSQADTTAFLTTLPKIGLQPSEAAIAVLSRRFGLEVERAVPAPSPNLFSASTPSAREILTQNCAATLPPAFRQYHADILRAAGDPAKTAAVIARIPYAARAAVLHESLATYAASP